MFHSASPSSLPPSSSASRSLASHLVAEINSLRDLISSLTSSLTNSLDQLNQLRHSALFTASALEQLALRHEKEIQLYQSKVNELKSAYDVKRVEIDEISSVKRNEIKQTRENNVAMWEQERSTLTSLLSARLSGYESEIARLILAKIQRVNLVKIEQEKKLEEKREKMENLWKLQKENKIKQTEENIIEKQLIRSIQQSQKVLAGSSALVSLDFQRCENEKINWKTYEKQQIEQLTNKIRRKEDSFRSRQVKLQRLTMKAERIKQEITQKQEEEKFQLVKVQAAEEIIRSKIQAIQARNELIKQAIQGKNMEVRNVEKRIVGIIMEIQGKKTLIQNQKQTDKSQIGEVM
jgi:hypothetical protein